MLNVVAIQGRLGADPELKTTPGGHNVCSINVAVDRGRTDANGQRQTDWLTVVAWDKTAEFICKYFGRGQMVAVSGRLQSRSYQAKDGSNRTAVEILAGEVSFCGNKAEGAAGVQRDTRQAAQPKQQPYAALDDDGFAAIEDEGDLPF